MTTKNRRRKPLGIRNGLPGTLGLVVWMGCLPTSGQLQAQGLQKPGESSLRAKRALHEVLQPSEAELSKRVTPVVRAVRATADSVVSILIVSPSRRTPFGQTRGGVDGQGSGVIIDEAGLVLTNWHVVLRATNSRSVGVKVRLKSGKTYDARVLSTSAKYDLALMQLELPRGDRVQPVTMGDSSSLMIGETVIAIGNPRGHQNTVTVGVLSAEDRSISVRAPDGRVRQYEGLLQTDAAINQGNSGGALLDITGRLIGINNAMSPVSENIGFAIPVNTVRRVFHEVLLSSENLTSVYLGMRVRESGGAAVLANVAPRGPAHRAGLRNGDSVVSVNGRPVGNTLDYARAIVGATANRPIEVRVERQGRELTRKPVPMSNAAWTVTRRIGAEFEVVRHGDDRRLVESATRLFYNELRERPRQAFSAVLRVTEVHPKSPAAEVGIQRGDILLGIVDRVPDLFGSRNIIVPYADVSALNDSLHVMANRGRNPSFEVWIMRDGEVLEGMLDVPRL